MKVNPNMSQYDYMLENSKTELLLSTSTLRSFLVSALHNAFITEKAFSTVYLS